ncbi:MAG: hypothetical protein HY700_17175 [Gemmatimonadetes bacterium]|nr:hypothetical protein [Gemmatimonadota bacterium]
MFTSRNLIIPLTLAAFGCSERAAAPTAAPMLQASVGSVFHRVTAGGPDICAGTGGAPGCDANFSLVALQGTGGVTGQWTDRFSQENGGGGIHVTINCISVNGNQAWVSGVGPTHAFGNEWVTRVVDNGTSAHDPADQLSFSIRVGVRPSGFEVFDCNAQQDLPLFDAPQGQVVVQ